MVCNRKHPLSRKQSEHTIITPGKICVKARQNMTFGLSYEVLTACYFVIIVKCHINICLGLRNLTTKMEKRIVILQAGVVASNQRVVAS